ncbi:SMC5-SMC6 complex localization factor protein 1-like [Pocillopora damicornis]|uniref:SMC5-SMC6 complex localization factor protein 1-like n=1 Tax=Pocillopora damicornis TaxID=46731 RepID=UPI000F558C2F|nr:SMC5-SMC6 complex localization factor protein 1-like [Pocillopora damicornis]
MAGLSNKRTIKKRFNFMLSSFDAEEKEKLSQWIRELGGTYHDSPNFVRSCTHIVCGKPNRGEKFLCGCVSGKWILRRQYIEDSMKAGKWLDEHLYEWNEQCAVEGISASHISSPSRWRKLLQQNIPSPFEGWKALVVVAVAKKRAAYKRLLEVGGATTVGGKPPYSASLASKITHIFVEKALEQDVQALQSVGVQCLSPDYIPELILQDPPPSTAEYLISAYNSPLSQPVIKLQRVPSRSKKTPVLSSLDSAVNGHVHVQSRIRKESNTSMPPLKISKATFGVGKENEPVLSSKKSKVSSCFEEENKVKKTSKVTQALHPCVQKENDQAQLPTRKRSKPSAEVSCSSESPNKKQKQENWAGLINCVERWRAVSSLMVNSKTHKGSARSEFPAYIRDSIDGYLEESHKSTVLDVIGSFVNSKRYPPLQILHTIIQSLLVKSPSNALAIKAHHLLQRILTVHTPSQTSSLYHSVLGFYADGDGMSDERGDSWEFMKTVYSDNDDNSRLLRRFATTLLEKDFNERINGTLVTPRDKLDRLKQSLLWKVFWPGSSSVSFNIRLRELFRVTWTAACSSRDKPFQIATLLSLQSLVAMAARCFIFSDVVSMKCNEDELGTRLSERSRTFVTELFLVFENGNEAALRRVLETCSPTWIRMQVTDMLLVNYNDHLVPLERRHLNTKGLSLEKIVSNYFFLLPEATSASTDSIPGSTPVNGTSCKRTPPQAIGSASNRKVRDINRRNPKGESDLQSSCIRNDVVKVKQLLAQGADANLQDYAGWTALHEACNHGFADCVQELLKARQLVYEMKPGHDPSKVLNLLLAPPCGTTPLHDAVGNGHQQVVELLVRAGGLPLLQAENAQDEKPVDLAAKDEIKEFLQTMELDFRRRESSCVTAIRPYEECYRAVLGKGRHSSRRVSTAEYEQYLLILSHLVQSYFRATRARTAFACDEQLWLNFGEHCDNLEAHVTRIAADRRLSSLASVRIQAMRMLGGS